MCTVQYSGTHFSSCILYLCILQASRKVAKCGYLFAAPDWDFSNPINRTKVCILCCQILSNYGIIIMYVGVGLTDLFPLSHHMLRVSSPYQSE